jgi:hypothetical protein
LENWKIIKLKKAFERDLKGFFWINERLVIIPECRLHLQLLISSTILKIKGEGKRKKPSRFWKPQKAKVNVKNLRGFGNLKG